MRQALTARNFALEKDNFPQEYFVYVKRIGRISGGKDRLKSDDTFVWCCPNKRKRAGCAPRSTFRSISLNSDDLASLIESASLASSVRKHGLSALRALGKTRHLQLPDVAAALVASSLGYFTLWYGHLVTPPWSKNCPKATGFTPYPSTAALTQPNGDRVLSCSRKDHR